VVAALATEGPLNFEDAAEVAEVPPENAYSLLSALRARSLVTRDGDHRYDLNRSGMAETVATADDGPHHELQEQWNVE
jgi:DNA-binding IclR family transcriptional regulator